MPPFEDLSLSSLTWGILNSSEHVRRQFKGIPTVTSIVADVASEYYYVSEVIRFDPESMEMTAQLHIRNRRGLQDILCGIDSAAAHRYIRSGKRWKEKCRRKKLKGACSRNE